MPKRFLKSIECNITRALNSAPEPRLPQKSSKGYLKISNLRPWENATKLLSLYIKAPHNSSPNATKEKFISKTLKTLCMYYKVVEVVQELALQYINQPYNHLPLKPQYISTDVWP